MNTKEYIDSARPRTERERLLVEFATLETDRLYSEKLYGYACLSYTGKLNKIRNELKMLDTNIFKAFEEL